MELYVQMGLGVAVVVVSRKAFTVGEEANSLLYLPHNMQNPRILEVILHTLYLTSEKVHLKTLQLPLTYGILK